MKAIGIFGKKIEVLNPQQSLAEFLGIIGHKPAVYTTMRTVNSRYLIEFDSHVERLAASGSAIFGLIKRLHGRDSKGDYTYTVVYSEPDTILVRQMPLVVPPEYCQIEIQQTQRRENPQVKSASWVLARQSIKKQNPESNEVVICDEQGRIYEGTSSNFFALISGSGDSNRTLITAPCTSVLHGTILSKAVEVSRDILGTKVSFEHPRADDIPTWTLACITSKPGCTDLHSGTSRLVLPVRRILYKEQVFDVPASPIAAQISALVCASLQKTALY